MINNKQQAHGISLRPSMASTSGRLHREFVCLLFLQVHRETDRFFCNFRSSTSTIYQWTLPPSSTRVVFFSQLKTKACDNILGKDADLCITLNITYIF